MTENTTSPTGPSSVDLEKQYETLWQGHQNQSEATDVYLASLRTRPLRIDHVCGRSVVHSKVHSSSCSTRKHASFYCGRACLRDQVACHSDLEKGEKHFQSIHGLFFKITITFRWLRVAPPLDTFSKFNKTTQHTRQETKTFDSHNYNIGDCESHLILLFHFSHVRKIFP